MNDAPDFDAYAPPKIARRVETVGVAKARMALLPPFTLAVVAGAFVALGAKDASPALDILARQVRGRPNRAA